MKLRFINTHALFPTAGLISTVASVSGVFSYLMVENSADTLLSIGGFMSVGGAVGLGLCIYFGWEVAFNHQGIAKRLAAGLIASSAATLSGYTLYQNAAHPILEQAHTAQLQQQTRTLQQQDTAAALLQQQQTDLRVQIEDLRQQNKADTASIATLEADTKAGEARQDKNANKNATRQVAQLRKAIEVRMTEIGKLSERVENYTQRLTATPVTKADNAGSESNDGNAPAQQPAVLSWAMLARASMYEVMTALFLLFGSWYRANRRETENAETTQLQNVTAQAHNALHDLQTATQVLVGVIAQATTIADALEAGQATTRRLLTEVAKQLESIRTKAIEGATLIQQQARSSEQLHTQATHLQDLLVGANEATEQLQQGVTPAKAMLQELQNILVSCNKATAQTDLSIARALECQSTFVARRLESQSTSIDMSIERRLDEAAVEIKEITQSDILLLLKNKRIEVDAEGLITDEKLMELTGWGTRKAKKAKETAFEQGYLDRKAHGKGFVYFYPAAQQLDLSNVVQLPARNA